MTRSHGLRSAAPERAAGQVGQPGREVDSGRALAALAAAALIGSAGNLTLPLWLGAVVEGLGAAERDAALVGSAELGCLAAASLLVAPRVERLSRRALVLAGALLLSLGHAAAALAPSLVTLAAARSVAGLGAGLVMAAANATAAGATLPERVYALMFVLGGAGCAVLMLVLPRAIASWGTAGAFGALLAATLLAGPLLAWMPARPPPGDNPPARGLPWRPAVAAALAASLIVMVGVDALWTFAERIGRGAGVERGAIGLVLAVASLAVLGAAALASWLGLRLGRVAPLCLGFGLAVAASLVLGQARSPGVWVGAVLVLGPAFYFTQPFMMGTMAALDPYGRVTTTGGAAMTVGAALGPAVGGLLAAGERYARLGWLGAACGLASLALIGGAALAAGRARAPGLT